MHQEGIGNFIMERPKEKGLTQAQLAEKLHITDRAVSKWETGKSLPDSSIMLELCGILEITTDQLLSGRREAPPKEPPLPRRGRTRWWCSVLFTGGLFLGTLVCFICDTALSGGFTWSRIVALSTGYGWAVLFPAAALRRGGWTGSLLSISVLTIPYLYGLSRVLGVRQVFSTGTVMTVISVLFLWLIWGAFRRWGRSSTAVGIMFLLLAGLSAAVSGALYHTAPPNAWNGMNILLLLLASAAAFTWNRRQG